VKRLVLIAVREYLENVRTKAFLIAVFMTPVLLGLSFLIPALLEKTRPEARRIAVADVTGELLDAFEKRISERAAAEGPAVVIERVELSGADPAAREGSLASKREDLDRRVKAGGLFAWVAIRPSAMTHEKGAPPSEYRTGNLIDTEVMDAVRTDLSEVSKARVVERERVPPKVADVLTTRLPLEALNVAATGKAGSIATTFMPFIFTFLLFLTIVTVSQALITSTLEEKGNRVIEVLLSSVSPFQLMAGKIVGTCAVGLTLMAIWSTAGFAGLALRGIHLVDAGQLLLCLAYYLLGFLLIASLMVAAGSACNTLKEAQNLLSPLMFLLTLPMFFWIVVGRDPHGTLARVLSLVPPFTPFLMMMRVASTPPPPASEIAISLLLLALTAWLAMRLAARVFRVGVLMYGKPPSLRELFRWMRAKN
jgi:ABC-2 type transport system permease protein